MENALKVRLDFEVSAMQGYDAITSYYKLAKPKLCSMSVLPEHGLTRILFSLE